MMIRKEVWQLENVISRQPWAATGILLVAVLCAFSPTFGNLLQEGWDDQWQVTNFYTTGGLTLENLRRIFTESYFTQYSPLNQCMYTLLYYIDGYNPMVFHAASLCLHAINALLVFRLSGVLLRDTTSLPLVQTDWISFLTALFFAIHPLQVESVAWVSASKILLYSFFYLSATWAFIHFLKAQEVRASRGWMWYALVCVFFLCAYGSKEQAVIFPAWATLLCFFYRKKVNVGSKVCYSLLPLYGIAMALGLLFIFGISQRSELREGEMLLEYPLWQRLVFSCYVVVEYVFKWFFPYRLLHLYVFPMTVGEPLPTWLLFYPILLFIGLSALWPTPRLRHWAVASGAAFFFLNIVFVLHIFPISRPNMFADRYVYLACIGLSFVMAYLFVQTYTRVRSWGKYMLGVFLLLVIVGCAVYSHLRTRIWYDTPTLKQELEDLQASRKTY